MTTPTPEQVTELATAAAIADQHYLFNVKIRRDDLLALCVDWEAKVATVEVLQQSVKRWQAERDKFERFYKMAIDEHMSLGEEMTLKAERDKLRADLTAAQSKIEGMIECHGQLHKARPEGVQCVCEEML